MIANFKVEYVGEGIDQDVSFVSVRYSGAYDLAKTLDCGQCFRWEIVEGSSHECEFIGVAHGKLISVAKDGDVLTFYNSDKKDFEELWCHYFALDEDYDAIDKELLENCNDETFAKAQSIGRGIRILRQEPWETVCSFIISQNNNIPRIKKIINSLSAALGERISPHGMEKHGATRDFYSFPTPQAVDAAGERFLFELKTGFRAKYIADAAQKWVDGELDPARVNEIDALDEAIEYLCSVKGIGIKVASCALLFGFERYDAFPVDVWMKRVLEKHFDKDFDPAVFGRYAGIAQQYLFDYERNSNK